MIKKSKQQQLGPKRLFALLALIAAFPPLSIDLYLPALPGIAKTLGAEINQVNLTLVVFFTCYAFGVLFWGPLSDKYGRKTILRLGLTIYCLSSAVCAMSDNIDQLIISRAFQAIGGSGATSVSFAIIKDKFNGRTREKMFAAVQTVVFLAPTVAPVFGGLILKLTSWHGVFWCMFSLGTIAFILSFQFEESLVVRTKENPFQIFGRLFVVLKNPGFSSLLLIFSIIHIPQMAFVASSSYIYVNEFSLTEQQYSYFIAANAICAVFCPMSYIQLSKRFNGNSIAVFCFAGLIFSGLLIVKFGVLNPLFFAGTMMLPTIFIALLQPFSLNLTLEQQKYDTGSASSLIGFTNMAWGSIGMLLITLDWPSYIFGLGMLTITTGILCISSWVFISGRSMIKHLPVSFSMKD